MNEEDAEKPPIELQKRPDTEYLTSVQQTREQVFQAKHQNWVVVGLVLLGLLVFVYVKFRKKA